MSRGNRKAPVFLDDVDRRCWFDVLNRVVERYAVRCTAYCLMSNHYHLVVRTPEANVSEAMRHLNGVYTQRYNRRYQTTGHVFEGRFTSTVVDDLDYLRTLVRYVVLNPVKAGLVSSPDQWQWSSYRATAGFAEAESWLDLSWIDLVFGAPGQRAHRRFRAFVLRKPGSENEDEDIDERAAILGSVEFQREVRALLPGPVPLSAGVESRQLSPRTHRAMGRPTLDELFRALPRRGPAFDRSVRRAHAGYAYQLSEIARFLGLHPTSVSAALRRDEGRTGQVTKTQYSEFL